jgi:hypothetical protein
VKLSVRFSAIILLLLTMGSWDTNTASADPEPFTLVVLGESRSLYGSPSFADRFATLLEDGSDIDVTVLNFACGGTSSANVLHLVEEFEYVGGEAEDCVEAHPNVSTDLPEALEDASLVAVSTGAADWVSATGFGSAPCGGDEECWGDRAADFDANWQAILSGIESYDVPILTMDIYNFLTELGPNAPASTYLPLFNAVIHATKDRAPIALVHEAFNRPIDGVDQNPSPIYVLDLEYDHVHPTPFGAQVMAFEFCRPLAEDGPLNADRNFIDNPSPVTVDDTSRPMSDEVGDACDADDDNDGLPDEVEPGLPSAECPSASGPLDPLNADTDGDGAMDGPECAIGTNPDDPASKPTADQCRILAGAASNSTDSDGDKIVDRIEVCGYGTSPILVDSDGDGWHDGCEAASLDGSIVVNSGDQLALAQVLVLVPRPYVWSVDLNKDGAVNSGDQLLMAQLMLAGANQQAYCAVN